MTASSRVLCKRVSHFSWLCTRERRSEEWENIYIFEVNTVLLEFSATSVKVREVCRAQALLNGSNVIWFLSEQKGQHRLLYGAGY